MENKPCDFISLSTSFVKLVHDYNEYAMKVAGFRAPDIAVPRSWIVPEQG